MLIKFTKIKPHIGCYIEDRCFFFHAHTPIPPYPHTQEEARIRVIHNEH